MLNSIGGFKFGGSHAKRSTIKTELIRYVRLSSELSDFLEIRKKFFNRLQNRGYPRCFLSEIFSEVHYDSRRKYLSRSKDKTKDVDQRVFSRPLGILFFKTLI